MEIALKPVEGPFGMPSLILDYPTVDFKRHSTVHVKPDLTDLPEPLKKILQPFVDSDCEDETPCPHLKITTSLTGTSESNYKGTMSVEDALESTGIMKAVSEYCGGGVKMNAKMRLESVRWSHGCEDMPAGSGVLVHGADGGWFWGMEEASVAPKPSSEKYECKKVVSFVPRWYQEDPEFGDEPYYDYDNKLRDWTQYWKSRWHSYLGDITITLILPN